MPPLPPPSCPPSHPAFWEPLTGAEVRGSGGAGQGWGPAAGREGAQRSRGSPRDPPSLPALPWVAQSPKGSPVLGSPRQTQQQPPSMAGVSPGGARPGVHGVESSTGAPRPPGRRGRGLSWAGGTVRSCSVPFRPRNPGRVFPQPAGPLPARAAKPGLDLQAETETAPGTPRVPAPVTGTAQVAARRGSERAGGSRGPAVPAGRRSWAGGSAPCFAIRPGLSALPAPLVHS